MIGLGGRWGWDAGGQVHQGGDDGSVGPRTHVDLDGGVKEAEVATGAGGRGRGRRGNKQFRQGRRGRGTAHSETGAGRRIKDGGIGRGLER